MSVIRAVFALGAVVLVILGGCAADATMLGMAGAEAASAEAGAAG